MILISHIDQFSEDVLPFSLLSHVVTYLIALLAQYGINGLLHLFNSIGSISHSIFICCFRDNSVNNSSIPSVSFYLLIVQDVDEAIMPSFLIGHLQPYFQQAVIVFVVSGNSTTCSLIADIIIDIAKAADLLNHAIPSLIDAFLEKSLLASSLHSNELVHSLLLK